MVALAIAEKGLDDFVIVRNNNFISIPLKPVKEKADNEKDPENKQDGKSQKSKTAKDKILDVKEKEKSEPTSGQE